MDAPLEVAIAAQHRDSDEAVVLDGRADGVGQRTAIADARGAAETHQLEIQFVQERRQPRGIEIVGDHLGAGGETRLHPGLGVQAALDGFFGQQAGAEHQRRIGCVRATGDGGDDHRAVRQLETVAIVFYFDVFLRRAFHGGGKRRFRLAQRHAILRALGPGERGLDLGEIEFERVGKDRVGRLIGTEDALQLGVSVDQGDAFGAAAGEAQIVERFRVHREEAHGRAVFGGHIGDGGAVGQSEAREAGAVEFDKLADDALLAQHLGDRQDKIGSRSAFRQAAVQLESHNVGDEHRERLPEHASFGFNAAHAPTEEDAQPVDHRGHAGVEVPTRESG